MGWRLNYPLQNKRARIDPASSTTVSEAVDLQGDLVVGVHVPASFEGTTLTFQAAPTSTAGAAGAYAGVKDAAGNDVSVTVAANKFVQVDPNLLAGVRFLKVVSGTGVAAIRDLYLATRPY